MPEDDFTVSRLVKAKVHLEPIPHGIHPKTRERLPINEVVNDPDVSGALRVAIEAIDQVIARGRQQ